MPKSKSTAKNKTSKRKTSSTKISRKQNIELEDISGNYLSCGNVFKDMGKSEEQSSILMMRSMLMLAIEDDISRHGWTQEEAAKVLGVARPRIAELIGSRLDLYSLDTLVRYLHRLGKRVSITVN